VFVRPEYWTQGDAYTDPHIKKNCTGYKILNNILVEKLEATQSRLNELTLNGSLASFGTATQIKNHIQAQIDRKPNDRGLVARHFEKFITRCNTPGTAGLYGETFAKVAKFSNIKTLRFENITVGWLKDFENWLRNEKLAINTIARHLRSVRAVYNDAIDHEVVQLNNYPFRRFKIKHEKTAKRSLTVEQLRELRDYPCEPHQEKYRDVFMLIFYLGGINMVDLMRLKEIENGRIEYVRSKTGVPVSLEVQPEAMEIIARYRGREHLLSMADEYVNYKDFLHWMDVGLKKIGTFKMVMNAAKDPVRRKRNKKQRNPILPYLSSYWARHTVATLMAEIDIPKETIAKVLGHSDNSVTDIYIRFDQRKIDDAMRRVIDYVNANIK
jgi:site-specific recombinase XerD